ncbi:YkvA family protein [Halioglobus sp. HI00S01]|uniref:YkvA family protein n=1 Tax=Halioglobus sp. HI00S01 TaxID=1822214 RepID=UPI0012E830EA|nr:YkvA family protein [Halioglobus sp. HI00S01]
MNSSRGYLADIMKDQNEFQDAYSEQNFWRKLTGYAKSAGREVVEKALLLFYAMQEEDAPAWAKATIAGALGYFIVPIDAIADLTPAVGYADDLGVLALAIAAVAQYINDDVRAKTAAKLDSWFGDDDKPD